MCALCAPRSCPDRTPLTEQERTRQEGRKVRKKEDGDEGERKVRDRGEGGRTERTDRGEGGREVREARIGRCKTKHSRRKRRRENLP